MRYTEVVHCQCLRYIFNSNAFFIDTSSCFILFLFFVVRCHRLPLCLILEIEIIVNFLSGFSKNYRVSWMPRVCKLNYLSCYLVYWWSNGDLWICKSVNYMRHFSFSKCSSSLSSYLLWYLIYIIYMCVRARACAHTHMHINILSTGGMYVVY